MRNFLGLALAGAAALLGESGVRNGSSRAIDVSASSGWTMGSTTARLDHTAGCVNEHFERDGQFRARSSTQTS